MSASINQDEVKKQIKKAVNVGLGVLQIAEDKLNAALGSLEKQGYINRNQGKAMAKDLLREANAFQKKLSARVDKGLQGIVKSSRVATKTKGKRKK